MLANRFTPNAQVIPVLAYPDAREAAAWLRDAFGFSVRLTIWGDRVQMNVGTGAVIVREFRPGEAEVQRGIGCSFTVRVDDAEAHCENARARGAQITQEACMYPYGERQYSAIDCGGYSWTFSQTVTDVDPKDWGGVAAQL